MLSEVLHSLNPRALPAGWRAPLGVFTGCLLLMLAVFAPTYWTMVDTWIRSETYAHGFLIVPLALFLVWRQRRHVAEMTPQTYLPAGVVLAGLAFIWLCGALVEVESVQQFAVVLMIPALVWLLLGTAVVWQLLFPLAYLVFAVPFGSFLIEPLMLYTADFTVGMVRLSGVPVYREGLQFSLPSGHWSVVAACSGVRYLIASVALGALYAHLTYRSWQRRTLFMVAAVIVPIVANGLRAYMIVMLGHLSDMQLAAGVDHLIYGWLFFGIVIFLMFWIGGFWRQAPSPVAGPGDERRLPWILRSGKRPLAALVVAVAVIGVAPGYAAWINRDAGWPAPDLGEPPLSLGDWQRTDAPPQWRPGYHDARDEWHMAYRQGDTQVGVYVGFYAEQKRHGQMVTWGNTLAGRDNDDWHRLRRGGGGALGAAEHHLDGPGTRIVAWQWYWVNGQTTTSRHVVKGLEALSRLLGGSDDAAHIVLFAPYTGRPDEAEQALEAFAETALPRIRDRLDEVSQR